MTGNMSHEFVVCKELSMQPGSLFELTSRFVKPERREALVALYALQHSIGSIPDIRTDDAVKWAKLEWWSRELASDSTSLSRHPVLRLLYTTGAREKLDNALILRLVSDAVSQIDVSPCPDEATMFQTCAADGETATMMELALDGVQISRRSLRSLCAATSLYRLVLKLVEGRDLQNHSVPLYLQAKFEVTLNELRQKPPPDEYMEIVCHLVEKASQWYREGLKACVFTGGHGSGAHLQLRWAIEQRWLARVGNNIHWVEDKRLKLGPAE